MGWGWISRTCGCPCCSTSITRWTDSTHPCSLHVRSSDISFSPFSLPFFSPFFSPPRAICSLSCLTLLACAMMSEKHQREMWRCKQTLHSNRAHGARHHKRRCTLFSLAKKGKRCLWPSFLFSSFLPLPLPQTISSFACFFFSSLANQSAQVQHGSADITHSQSVRNTVLFLFVNVFMVCMMDHLTCCCARCGCRQIPKPKLSDPQR